MRKSSQFVAEMRLEARSWSPLLAGRDCAYAQRLIYVAGRGHHLKRALSKHGHNCMLELPVDIPVLLQETGMSEANRQMNGTMYHQKGLRWWWWGSPQGHRCSMQSERSLGRNLYGALGGEGAGGGSHLAKASTPSNLTSSLGSDITASRDITASGNTTPAVHPGYSSAYTTIPYKQGLK